MTRMLPRTNLHSSELIRCLADLGIADVVDPGNAFAEKLGQWIHFADAITLSGVHNESIRSTPYRDGGTQLAACTAACAEFDRTRASLVNAILKSCSPRPGSAYMNLLVPEPKLPMDFTVAYAPYRRFYERHQHDMSLSIQPLRVRVREAVAKVSPRLGKLAELDAVFEKVMHERESKLLPRVPVLLKRRFEHLFGAHQQTLADVPRADKPAEWTQAGGWLARFCLDMQTLLLAEVDFRLQPTVGLIEAFRKDTQ